jgi:predicted lipoprotein with Yx(FWY)xxD motif
MESYKRSMTRILPRIASIGRAALARVGRATAVALGCAALLAACGDDSTESPAAGSEQAPAAVSEETKASAEETTPSAEEASSAGAARGPLVKLRDSQLGPVLFSGSDRAVYTFTLEGDQARNRCRGDCAVAWPPFFARGRPRAGRGVKPSLLGTVRRGSRRQVTYRGQRLYFYVSDPKGEVLCNDIVEFGGTWFAVTAQGRPPA